MEGKNELVRHVRNVKYSINSIRCPTLIASYRMVSHRVFADNAMEVFSLAHRFDMRDLLRACAEVLDECMQCDDVCRVLEAAAYYGHADLAAKCWGLIKDSAPR